MIRGEAIPRRRARTFPISSKRTSMTRERRSAHCTLAKFAMHRSHARHMHIRHLHDAIASLADACEQTHLFRAAMHIDEHHMHGAFQFHIGHTCFSAPSHVHNETAENKSFSHRNHFQKNFCYHNLESKYAICSTFLNATYTAQTIASLTKHCGMTQ